LVDLHFALGRQDHPTAIGLDIGYRSSSRAGSLGSGGFYSPAVYFASGAAESKSAELIKRLAAVTPGKATGKAFENVGVDILSHVFSPALGAPDIQSRSDDGLD